MEIPLSKCSSLKLILLISIVTPYMIDIYTEHFYKFLLNGNTVIKVFKFKINITH